MCFAKDRDQTTKNSFANRWMVRIYPVPYRSCRKIIAGNLLWNGKGGKDLGKVEFLISSFLRAKKMLQEGQYGSRKAKVQKFEFWKGWVFWFLESACRTIGVERPVGKVEPQNDKIMEIWRLWKEACRNKKIMKSRLRKKVMRKF